MPEWLVGVLIGGVVGYWFRGRIGRLSSTVESESRALEGPDWFAVEVVGESHYQDALERICGGRSEDGADLVIEAQVILDDDNPFDPKAVRIDIRGETVGHLSRAMARQYRSRLREAGHPHTEGHCKARIRGGWERPGGDSGSFGVYLDLPTED